MSHVGHNNEVNRHFRDGHVEGNIYCSTSTPDLDRYNQRTQIVIVICYHTCENYVSRPYQRLLARNHAGIDCYRREVQLERVTKMALVFIGAIIAVQ